MPVRFPELERMLADDETFKVIAVGVPTIPAALNPLQVPVAKLPPAA